MLHDTPAFSGFSVSDLEAAQAFYGDTLGLTTKKDKMGLTLSLVGAGDVFVYEKPNHEAASFTILNFGVPDIDKAIDDLEAKGVHMEHYDNLGEAKQDEKGVLRGLAANMGPDIAWFKDPFGNILSVLQTS